ncbi:MAG: apolipoprotein N-acyltransferase [Endozoicomonas sp. (ex Botrylloides leachii)]|nr:apolipoprotein N-acyltransferase [Endozoicomonas sp. (ex Botrylloides leachii)]
MNNEKKPAMRYLITLLSGAMAPLGFSPFNLWPLLMVAVAILFMAHRNMPTRQALLNGFMFGVGMFGVGTSWIYVSIHQFGSASPALASLLTAVFVIVISLVFVAPGLWLYSKLRHHWHMDHPCQQALLFSAFWVIAEWTRSWLLTGFPWLLAGYSLLDTPAANWAPVTGVYGLSFLLVITSTLLVSLIIKSKQPLRKTITSKVFVVITIASLWLASWPLAKVQWTEPTGEKLTFSAIQGNIPQSIKWHPDYIQNIIATYTNQTEQEWKQDLIIWPENALPIFYSRAQWLLQQLSQQGKNHNTALIIGLPIDMPSENQQKYYNGIIAIGAGTGIYDKQKLVPFGEYVPFESLLRGLIAFFDLPMSSFSAGSSNQKPLNVKGITITPYICYEVVYPDFAARMARHSGLLLTISDDTWFGKSIGPEQHFQMARMRALETGRYLIRDTNDGLTALINNHGKVLQTIPRFKEGILRGSANIMLGNTPFMITGSWPILILCLGLQILCYFQSRFKKY